MTKARCGGNFFGNWQQGVAVATASSGLSGKLSLLLANAVDLQVRWIQEHLGTFANDSGKRCFSMPILDLDQDGRAEILLSNSWGEHGRRYAFNHDGRQPFSTTDPRIPNLPYLDPADRDVTIVLQRLDGVACRDLLSGENLPMDGSRVRLQIPAGTLRVVDSFPEPPRKSGAAPGRSMCGSRE